MPQFVIKGGKKLHGEVRASGSKNAVLPILVASLLTADKCVIKNVPDIEDVRTMLAILQGLGSKVSFRGHTVIIQTKKINQKNMPSDLGCRMRASVLLLGPLLARTGYARLPYPGGCVLGARPIDTHTNVLSQMGIKKIKDVGSEIVFEAGEEASKSKHVEVVLPEFSVTATENAVMAAALSFRPSRGEATELLRPKGASLNKTTIRLAAIEPHVQDLCRFIKAMGAHVEGIGTHNVVIIGAKCLHGVDYSITPDYLEVGTFVLASVLTRGDVVVKNIVPHDLDALWNLLREMDVKFTLDKNSVHIKTSKRIKACNRLQTNVFPGFPTDLQPPFVILLTQAEGQSRVHETLFEGRFAYFPDLIKIGAKIKVLNPHEAVITGPVKLKGTAVKSWDIRAGAAMILAGLAASGTTVIKDIHYIDRGYEGFDEKLRLLGADITRLA